MTHDERVNHHMYETLEGIAEQSERIASLEEALLDLWPRAAFTMTKKNKESWLERFRGLGLEVDDA